MSVQMISAQAFQSSSKAEMKTETYVAHPDEVLRIPPVSSHHFLYGDILSDFNPRSSLFFLLLSITQHSVAPRPAKHYFWAIVSWDCECQKVWLCWEEWLLVA